MAEGIGMLIGLFLGISFLGYFYPMVGLVTWGLVFLLFAYFNLVKDAPDEPDTLSDRLKMYPQRVFYMAVPFCFFLGYLAYANSDNFSELARKMDRIQEREDSSSRDKDRYLKSLEEAAGKYYDKNCSKSTYGC